MPPKGPQSPTKPPKGSIRPCVKHTKARIRVNIYKYLSISSHRQKISSLFTPSWNLSLNIIINCVLTKNVCIISHTKPHQTLRKRLSINLYRSHPQVDQNRVQVHFLGNAVQTWPICSTATELSSYLVGFFT